MDNCRVPLATSKSPNEREARKICFASHDPGVQGAERALIEMADLFQQAGWDVSVIIPGRTGGLWDIAKDRGLRRLDVRYLYWMGPGTLAGRVRRLLTNLRALVQLRRLIQRERFDVIYTHSTAVGVTAIAARSLGIPHVWHMHEYGPYGPGDVEPVYDFGERATLATMRWSQSVYVAVAEVIAQTFRPRLGHEADIRVIPQPVSFHPDVDPRDAVAVGRISQCVGPKILYIGAVTATKRQKDAVRSLPGILDRYPEARLFFGGRQDNDYLAEVIQLARELGVAHAVTALGFLHNAPSLIALADISINCRLAEAAPRVLIESMYAKTPVIAAGDGGNVECLEPGLGLLYAPADPTDLAAKVVWALDNPAEVAHMVDRAFLYAMQTRSEAVYGQKYLAAIASAIDAARALREKKVEKP